jgi:alkanesulfonate monooxygenase SsuD/methylene tetrahydromethanopterin reductase-like flavin-dependent oxidoreductase (luciferase family)
MNCSAGALTALADAKDCGFAHVAPFALGQFGLDFTYGDIHDLFPSHELPRPQDVEKTIKSTFGNYVGLYNWIQERPGVTVREDVAQAVGRGGATHRKFVGTYDDLVEDFAAWHEDGNVGGFNLMFSAGSAAIREFIDEVVPRLTDRGIYRPTPADRPLR